MSANVGTMREVLSTVTAGLASTVRAVEALQAKQADLLQVCGELRTEIALLRKEAESQDIDVKSLFKILRDGNGQPSLLERVLQAETRLAQMWSDGQPFVTQKLHMVDTKLIALDQQSDGLKRTLDALQQSLSQLEKTVDKAASARVMSTGQIVVGLGSAVLGLILSVVALIGVFLAK